MKKRIRQRLIERESFLPFGSVKFDTRDTSHNYQTDLQKMFEDLKAKVLEEKEVQQNGIDPYETEAEEEEFKKKKKFFDSVTSCQDKNMFTDVETDNEYGRTDIGSDSSEDDYEELEIEINPLKIPSLPSLIFTPEKPSDSTMVTRTVQKLQDGGVTEDEHHEDPSVKISSGPEDRKQPGRQSLPEEEKEKPEEPPEFGAAAFANKEEVPKIVPKPSKKSSEPLFGKKIVDKVNLPPIEVNNSSKPKKTEEEKSSEVNSSDQPSSSQSVSRDSRDRVQDESDCNYDSDASLYDPMAMFMKRDKINPPSDGNKTSMKEDSSKFRSEENRRDRLRNDRHYDDKYDHDYRDRRRPTRSGGRQRSEYDDRREEYDRRRDEYDSRDRGRDDRDRRREDRYQDEDRTRSTRRSDSRDRSPEKLARSRDRSPVRTRSKPVRDRTRSPDRKSKSKIVEKESRSRKRSHSSDEDVDRKSKKSKKKDRSPKSRKTSTDDILNEILVVDKKPDDLKARMMARMAKQKSREQTPTQEKEPTPIRTIKSPDPLAESEVFVKTKEKKKSKESKKSSSSSEPTFFVKLDKKIDLKMNENNSNSSRVEKNREERRESKRLKSKKESKSSRKRRSRSPSGPEEPEENQKEKEMAERMKKRAARFKQPPPAVTSLVTPQNDENLKDRTLERIIGDDAPDDVIIDDVTNDDSIENFKMSKNFENIKKRLLDRAPKSSMLPKSSSKYEDDDVMSDDDVISIADSEVSLATTVLLNSKDVQDKRNGFKYA